MIRTSGRLMNLLLKGKLQFSRNRQFDCYRYQTSLKPSLACLERFRKKKKTVDIFKNVNFYRAQTDRGSGLISIDYRSSGV